VIDDSDFSKAFTISAQKMKFEARKWHYITHQ
jgi:hypothetical protein